MISGLKLQSEITAGESPHEIQVPVQEIERGQGMQIGPTDLFEDSSFGLSFKLRNGKEQEMYAAAARIIVFVAG